MNHAVRAARAATESDPKRLGFYLDLCVVAGFLRSEIGQHMLQTADRVGAALFATAQRQHADDNSRHISDYGWALVRSLWPKGPTALTNWSSDKLEPDSPGMCHFDVVCLFRCLYIGLPCAGAESLVNFCDFIQDSRMRQGAWLKHVDRLHPGDGLLSHLVSAQGQTRAQVQASMHSSERHGCMSKSGDDVHDMLDVCRIGLEMSFQSSLGPDDVPAVVERQRRFLIKAAAVAERVQVSESLAHEEVDLEYGGVSHRVCRVFFCFFTVV